MKVEHFPESHIQLEGIYGGETKPSTEQCLLVIDLIPGKVFKRQDIDNYFFYFWGISEKEKLRAGGLRKIKLTIKELYPNQNNFIPLDIEYRVFTTVGDKYEIDVIPFTPVNRTSKGYEFNLDTSWLIPQDYCIQLRLRNGTYYDNKECVNFTVVSDGIKK